MAESRAPRIQVNSTYKVEEPINSQFKAVDLSVRGRGLGKALLKHTLPRINGAIEILSGRAVVVHALDDEAMKFYARYGFESSPIDSETMMLLVKDMRASLAQAGGKREE